MGKSVEYYLSRGFDRRMAEYFSKGRRRIVSVDAHEDYTLALCFDNGERRLYDCVDLLRKGTVFEVLLDRGTFLRAYLDEEACVAWDIDPTVDSRVVWSNKLELCPDTCYVDSVPITGGDAHV